MDAIIADNLTRTFADVPAVGGLTLAVPEGEVFGLVGPDGAGKTTTLRLLATILEPTAGSARVAGFDIVSQAERVKEHIGYMSQRFGLYGDLTVLENLDFYADIYGLPRRQRPATYDRLLSFAGLSPFKRRLAGNLSGGMKQKLALACALVHTPQVLLLDEPTNGVDPVSRRDFWRILYQLLRQRVTILIATAYLDEAERCGRIGLLDAGRLLAVGAPDQVKGLMRGTILEIRVDRPRQAVRALRVEFAAGAVGLFGDRVHVVSDDPDNAQRQARTVLAASGLEVAGIRVVPPTLEDVFISVLGAQKTVPPV